MAEACVMVRPKDMDGMLTPTKGPHGAHLDTSLITSAIRKRKVDQPESQAEEKKARSTAVVVGYGLAVQPAAAAGGEVVEASVPSCGPSSEPPEQLEQPCSSTGDAVVQLFSPVFHAPGGTACGKAGGANLIKPAASGQAAAAAAEASTDHSTSTGTSATMDTDGSSFDCDGVGAAATASTSAGPVSPPPLQPQPHAAEGDAREEEEEDCLDFDPFLFIKRLPPVEHCIPPRHHFLLPRQTRRSKRKTLVLDLDETLVHSTLDGYCRSDFVFPVEVGSVRHMVSVRQRPHLHTFLQRMAELFEVVVFTASQRVYAEQLLNLVDPGRTLIRHRIFRESCVLWEGNYLKDLTVLGRDLAHTIIVDNSPQAFGFQLDNGIPIESWYDDDSDQELLKLLPFLEQIAECDDVRPHIQHRFRLRQLVEAAPEPKLPLLLLGI